MYDNKDKIKKIMIGNSQEKIQFTQSGHIVILNGATFEVSGVNFYILNIAKSLKKKGYRVTVICQDRNAQTMSEIDEYIQGDFDKTIHKLKDGHIRVIVPNVGGIIPIYASFQSCEFEGMTSKVIQQMTEAQIRNNIQMTKVCLRDVCEHDRPFKVIANYMLLSGIIAAEVLRDFRVPYDIIVPGPALMYTVKPYPHLWKWVFPGFKRASIIFQHTEFVKTQFLKCFKNYVEQYEINRKVVSINPGIDVNQLKMPQSQQECELQFIAKVKQSLLATKNPTVNRKLNFSSTISAQQLNKLFFEESKKYNQVSLQENLLQKWIPFKQEDETILYAGAMLNNKGMGELLAIAPKLISQRPNLKFIFYGAGPYKTHMYELVNAFQQGNFAKAKLIAEAGQFISQINIEDYFFKADKSILNRIIFCGLGSTSNHFLRYILPLCTLFVVPSKILESCSIGLMKALCFGVTPISNDHSWMAEVNNIIEKDYPQISKITRIQRDQFFQKLPQTIINTLNFIKTNKLSRKQYRKKIRKIAENNYSWDHLSSVLATQRQFIQIKK